MLPFCFGAELAQAGTIVCADSNAGDFCVELYDEEAPLNVANFLSYVDDGSYDNTMVHRSVKGVSLHGGEFQASLNVTPINTNDPVPNEFSRSNIRGTLAMRTQNGDPDSATSGWFINLSDNSQTLDQENGGYTVIGKVIGDGMEVVDLIASLPVLAFNTSVFTKVPVVAIDDNLDAEDLVVLQEVYRFEGDPNTIPGYGDEPDGGNGGGETPSGDDVACLETNVGNFCMELFAEATPLTVQNFINYITDGDYDGTIIHRSVPGFVIQGGGYTLSSSLSATSIPRDPAINNEFGISNTRATVAMAKVSGNPNSATSEWFINLVDNSDPLDSDNGGFTVFAEVFHGMEVVDFIADLPTVALSGLLQSPPLVRQDVNLSINDFVSVERVYLTSPDNLPDINLGGQSNDIVTEYANQRMSLPVRIGNNTYRVILNATSTSPEYVFQVDLSRIIQWNANGAEVATFFRETGELYIPSVWVSGVILTDVLLDLSDPETLEFTLRSFNKP